MTYYEVLLFVHIFAVAIWFGTGFALLLLGSRLRGAGDDAALHSLFGQSDWLTKRIFIPISLLALVAGILLVLEGPWSFGELWIVLGLAGFAATFLTGILLLKPHAERIAARLSSDGMTDAAAQDIGSMFTRMRIDYTVIALVFVDMTLKPTGDDVLVLALMAAILAAAVALVFRSERSRGAASAAGAT